MRLLILIFTLLSLLLFLLFLLFLLLPMKPELKPVFAETIFSVVVSLFACVGLGGWVDAVGWMRLN